MHTILTMLLGLGLFLGNATLARMDQGALRPAAVQAKAEQAAPDCCCCCCCVVQCCGCATCKTVVASTCGGGSCSTGTARK